jgi:AcrR family transcriptional regulator
MGPMQAIQCPKCGGSKLTETSPNRRRCDYCGTESVLSVDRSRLELIGSLCPACGFNNEPRVAFCGKCGTPMVRICAGCLARVSLDLAFCSSCGANCETERQALFSKLASLTNKPEGQQLEHVLAYLDRTLKVDPGDVQALAYRGQLRVRRGQWREGVADWADAYGRDPNDTTTRGMLREFISPHIGLLMECGLVDARLTDDLSKRYLGAIRSSLPSLPTQESQTPPPPLGQLSIGLLNRLWPSKAARMEAMYQEKVVAFHLKLPAARALHEGKVSNIQAERKRIERDKAAAFRDLPVMARMCAVALEEQENEKERLRQEVERRKAQEMRDEEARARPAPPAPVVIVRSPSMLGGCCSLPILAGAVLLPALLVALLQILL